MSSAQGRFTSGDPDNYDARLEQPQSWNLYAHTWNNPHSYVDTDGRAVIAGAAILGSAGWRAGIGFGVGFATGFGGSAISQQQQNGTVDWRKATAYGFGSGASGSLAFLSFGGTLLYQAAAGAVVGTVGNGAGGMISRGAAGEEILDRDAVTNDLVSGATFGALGSTIQFIGAVVNLPPIPKAPTPLASVVTRLRRIAKLNAWQRTREFVGNKYGMIGGAISAVLGNTVAQGLAGQDAKLNELQLRSLQEAGRTTLAPKENVTFRMWFPFVGDDRVPK